MNKLYSCVLCLIPRSARLDSYSPNTQQWIIGLTTIIPNVPTFESIFSRNSSYPGNKNNKKRPILISKCCVLYIKTIHYTENCFQFLRTERAAAPSAGGRQLLIDLHWKCDAAASSQLWRTFPCDASIILPWFLSPERKLVLPAQNELISLKNRWGGRTVWQCPPPGYCRTFPPCRRRRRPAAAFLDARRQ